MKKNDVFTFTAPNGVEVTAVVVAYMNLESYIDDGWDSTTVSTWLCYAQNRLFTYKHKYSVLHDSWGNARAEGCGEYGEVIVDYAILPDYDQMLALYQAMDYPLWEQNMEKHDPDEGEDIFWDSCAEEHNKQEDV